MPRSGWFKLWRKLGDNPIWEEKPFSPGQAWIDLLIRANFSETRIPKPGKKANVTLAPGEAIVSLRELELNWGWSRNRVLRFFSRLKNEHMIGTTNETTFTRLKILNWKKLQGDDEQGGTGSGTGDGTTRGTTQNRRTEPPTEPPSEPGTEPIRRTEENNNNKNTTPPVYSTPHVAPSRDPGDDLGAVVAVPEKTGDGNHAQGTAPKRSPETSRMLNYASVRLSTPILEAAGVDRQICEGLARAHPAIRILHVCEHARKQENPGGFIRKALEEGWKVPDSNGDGLAKLVAAVEAEISAKDRVWGAGFLKRAPDCPIRKEGETDESYMERVNEWVKSKKSEGAK